MKTNKTGSKCHLYSKTGNTRCCRYWEESDLRVHVGVILWKEPAILERFYEARPNDIEFEKFWQLVAAIQNICRELMFGR